MVVDNPRRQFAVESCMSDQLDVEIKQQCEILGCIPVMLQELFDRCLARGAHVRPFLHERPVIALYLSDPAITRQ